MPKNASELSPEYFTLEELSVYSGVATSTLRHWKRSGMPYYKLGRLVRIKRSDFDAWVAKFQVNGTPDNDRRRQALAEAIKEAEEL